MTLVSLVAAPAALFSTLFLFAPAQMYYRNVDDFPYRFSPVLPFLVASAAAPTLVVAAILMATRDGVRARGVAIIVTLACGFWTQGNLLLWNYGALDGQVIAWTRFPGARAAEFGVWGLLLTAGVRFAGPVSRWATPIALTLIVMQGTAIARAVAAAPAPEGWKLYSVQAEDRYAYSSTRNVFVVVVDMFQTDVFAEIVAEDPALVRQFAGFTYFRNATSAYGATYASLTDLLTGQKYDNSVPLQAFIRASFLSKYSLPRVLKQEGFVVSLVSTERNPFVYIDPTVVSNLRPRYPPTYREIGRLVETAWFRYLPHDGKRVLFGDNAWFFRRRAQDRPITATGDPPFRGRRAPLYNDATLALFDANHTIEPRFLAELEAQARVAGSTPAMRFYHLRGPHYPLRLNEQLQFEKLPDSREGYRRQANGSLRVVARFLDALRRIGVYDQSIIVVAADHGFRGPYAIGYHAPDDIACPAPASSPVFVDPNQKGSGLPLILVKRLGDAGPLRISDAPVALGDVPATVLAALGVAAPAAGRSMYDAHEATRPRYFFQDVSQRTPKGYYGPLREYVVRGFAGCDASWQATGRVLLAAE